MAQINVPTWHLGKWNQTLQAAVCPSSFVCFLSHAHSFGRCNGATCLPWAGTCSSVGASGWWSCTARRCEGIRSLRARESEGVSCGCFGAGRFLLLLLGFSAKTAAFFFFGLPYKTKGSLKRRHAHVGSSFSGGPLFRLSLKGQQKERHHAFFRGESVKTRSPKCDRLFVLDPTRGN